MRPAETVTLAMTGASGAVYGLRLLECLLAAGRRVYFLMSKPARLVLAMESDVKLSARPAEARRQLLARLGRESAPLEVFGIDQWTAPVASGSGAADAMVVCPCTTGSLAAIANGLCDNLIHRAADVSLKERRPLLLVLRETPYSAVHLENMLALTRAGAVVLPANPGFYHRPQRIEELVDFVVARVLDQLGVEHVLLPRWGHERA
ncbi:MAG: flavin prenyltransferase UbiX [Gammaproteobacteria bacterium]|nr:MAG: flavin prenyltransferase UbiX [Gammaproteobacteria bacterium]